MSSNPAFDWSDVSDADVSSGALRMNLRKGGAAELPRAIAEDSGFRESVRGWLAVEHPVRRAIDPPAGG